MIFQCLLTWVLSFQAARKCLLRELTKTMKNAEKVDGQSGAMLRVVENTVINWIRGL